ncbi:hypothetical protein [Streptomyces anulatus]
MVIAEQCRVYRFVGFWERQVATLFAHTAYARTLAVNNALPYVKPVADPQVESIDVDFCHDLTPAAGPGGEERTKAFLARTVPIDMCGVKARGCVSRTRSSTSVYICTRRRTHGTSSPWATT